MEPTGAGYPPFGYPTPLPRLCRCAPPAKPKAINMLDLEARREKLSRGSQHYLLRFSDSVPKELP